MKTQTAVIDEDAVESFIVCLGSAFLDFIDMNLYSHNCIQCILVSMKVKMCLFPWTSKTNGSTAKQDLDLTEVNRRLKKKNLITIGLIWQLVKPSPLLWRVSSVDVKISTFQNFSFKIRIKSWINRIITENLLTE